MPRPTPTRLSTATSGVLGVSVTLVLIAGVVTAATQSWHDGSGGPVATASAGSPSVAAGAASSVAGPSPHAAVDTLASGSSPSPLSVAPSTAERTSASAAAPSTPTSTGSPVHTPARASSKAKATASKAAPSSPPSSAGIKPGTYTYDETGTFTSSLGDQSADGTSTLVVSAVGSDGYQSANKDGSRSSEDELLRFDPDGVHMRELHVTFPTVDETFDFAPAVLFVPLPSASGQPWSWGGTSTDGKAQVTYSGSIAGTTSDTVGGTTVKVTTIKSVVHFTGSGFDITVDESDHFDEADRAITETDQMGKGTISGVRFTSSTTEKLRSLKPS